MFSFADGLVADVDGAKMLVQIKIRGRVIPVILAYIVSNILPTPMWAHKPADQD